MKTVQDLYNERLNRIKKAVSLGKPDRTPFAALGNAFCARHLDIKMSEFAKSPELSTQTMLKSFTSLGEIDANQVQMFFPPVLSMIWLSNVRIPGKDLPDDAMWQVEEAELMQIEDYDTIIDKGYNTFFGDFQKRKLNSVAELVESVMMPHAVKGIEEFTKAGIVVFAPFNFTTPFENFCGGRSMTKFLQDLFRIPDKVQAAMDSAMIDIIQNIRGSMKALKPVGAWVGGWRSASIFVSPKLWQRFVWKYYKQLVNVVIEEGGIPILHLDSDWERDLEFFKELPKGKCVFSPDGQTNIFKVKEVLNGHMCIMGDVPASMLSLGTPDDVYEYSSKLIKEIGPSGYILASGCDIPSNAKPENVKAMISAATGK